MRIYVIPDHSGYNKTILNVVERWREQGHEVVVDMYYDVNKADWCDVIFGEYIQGGVVHACKDQGMTKPVVVRGIDIDLYFGHYAGIDWNRCKAVLFINNYMKDMIVEKYKIASGREINTLVDVVHLGIDETKWTYRDRSAESGKTIGWINNFWSGKGVGTLLQVIIYLANLGYNFEIVGEGHEPWLIKYWDEFIARNNLGDKVKRIKYVVSVDKWMDGIDFILSTSMKECMSLPMVEAMAKGIKPLVHNWWGADELYPKDLVWNSLTEIPAMVEGPRESERYRQFVLDNYTLDKQVNKLNNILGL